MKQEVRGRDLTVLMLTVHLDASRFLCVIFNHTHVISGLYYV